MKFGSVCDRAIHYLRKLVAEKSRLDCDRSPRGTRIDGRRIFTKRTEKRERMESTIGRGKGTKRRAEKNGQIDFSR